jgi:hypothetical protein
MSANNGISLPSSNRTGDSPPRTRNRRSLIAGAAGSLIVLASLLALQAKHAAILKLPSQWLALATIPVVLGLVLGGYLGRFSFAGIEVEAPSLKPVPYVAPASREQTKTAEAAPSPWTGQRQAEYERTRFLELVHIYKPSTRLGQQYWLEHERVGIISGNLPCELQ